MTCAMIELQPIPTNTMLTSREAAVRAHSQLLSVIVGKSAARDTSSLQSDPVGRTAACLEIAMKEFMSASRYEDADERNKRVSQVQRKLASLDSLKTFASLIDEVEDWE